MRILAISLLRLGDILMLAPVLKGLKDQNPNTELHVLVNKQFMFVKNILPWVDKFIPFERNELQKGMGEIDRSIFEPIDRLDSLIKYLDRQHYSTIYNLTHSKLSGYLTSLISCENKVGMTLSATGTASFGNKWYNFLNETGADSNNYSAHFLDIHYYGSELPPNTHQFNFEETKEGIEEADSILSEENNFICVQPLTSDSKKNWSFEKYARTLSVFSQFNSNLKIYVLGAPNESDEISKFISVCQKEKVNVLPAICSLEGALSILSRSRLLLTGDTSIKHLACATDCKILEVSLGSSDFRKTGVYKSNSYIIASQATCFPCTHSLSCHQSSHICGNTLSTDCAALLMGAMLNGTSQDIENFAMEYSDSTKVFKTYFSHSGFWHAKNLSESSRLEEMEQVIRLSAWKLYNQGEHLKLIGSYGTESIKLKAALKQAFPEKKASQTNTQFKTLEIKAKLESDKIEILKLALKNALNKKETNLLDFTNSVPLISLEYSFSYAKDVEKFAKSYDGDPLKHFVQLRKLSEAIDIISKKKEIQLKLLRNMIQEQVESL